MEAGRSEYGTASLIIVGGVYVVLLVGFHKDDLFKRLSYFFVLLIVTEGNFMVEALLLAIRLSFTLRFD